MAVRTVFGAAEFGGKATLAESIEMVNYFLGAGHKELDTAYMYANGKSEEFLGEIPVCHDAEKVSMATKINPWIPGGLSTDGVRQQVNTSLQRLKSDSVDILYLHAPDHKTPIEETLQEVQKQYEAGRFKELGLSNYSSWEVVEIYYLCKSKGWILPTLYQGMYNALTRDVERELFPALRRLGMRFYAYNPLSCGLMTGKYKFEDTEDTVGQTRFFGGTWSGTYRQRYWKRCYFDALDVIRESLTAAGSEMSLTEASLRWMYHHSKLAGQFNDCVVLGASCLSHLKENMAAAEKGPLDAGIVEAFEKAWLLTRPECQAYFR